MDADIAGEEIPSAAGEAQGRAGDAWSSLQWAVLAAMAVPVVLTLGKRAWWRARFVRMVDRVPGPFAVPLLGSIVALIGTKREDIFKSFDESTRAYWPIMRTWKGTIPDIHLSSADDIEVILGSTTHIKKSSFYDFIKPWLGDGLLTGAETAMGTRINAQGGSHSEYFDAVYDLSKRTFERIMRPWLHPDFIFVRSAIGKQYMKALATLHGFTKKVIEDRRESRRMSEVASNADVIGAKRRLAFLDLLLEAAQGGAALSDDDIREEVDTFMFEGHDTTAASLCWCLFLLGSHPAIQDKVYEELEGIFGASARAPSMQDLSEMKLLERVLKESLRLYPSVPIIGRHLQEDVKIGKYLLPAGCDITVHIYHVHRNPEYYPNPDKFDPDNFLPERVQGRHPYAYIPFSAGSRNCIGQKFALLEEKTVLSTLLRSYSFTALERAEDVRLTGELVLRPLGGLRMRVQPRAPTTAL